VPEKLRRTSRIKAPVASPLKASPDQSGKEKCLRERLTDN
jgi:hypothetical protein